MYLTNSSDFVIYTYIYIYTHTHKLRVSDDFKLYF